MRLASTGVDSLALFDDHGPLSKSGSPRRHKEHGEEFLMIQSRQRRDDWIINSIPSKIESPNALKPSNTAWNLCFKSNGGLLFGDLPTK
jgi:hypothetical protein